MRSPPRRRSPSCASSWRVTGGPSSAARRRSWSARPSSSSWRSRRWKPTRPSGSPPPRRSWRRRSRPPARAQKPARRPLPEHLPREDVIHSAPCTCPDLRRRVAPDRRGRHRDARLRAGPVQGDPACPREAVLPGLRYRRRRAGARPRDCPRPCRRRALGPYRRLQVRRSSAAVPTSRDLRPRRRQPGDLDLVRLGRGDGGGSATADRRARRRR